MKTITVNNKEYKQVHEVVCERCTGCDLFGEVSAECFKRSGFCLDNRTIYKEITNKLKTKKVSFYRYHHPIDLKTGHAKSDQGVTFFVKINYKRRTMRVSCSVCNGDNFSKERGKIQASTRYDFGRYLEFHLDDYVNSDYSVLDYLRITLDPECHLPEFEAAIKQLRRMYAK